MWISVVWDKQSGGTARTDFLAVRLIAPITPKESAPIMRRRGDDHLIKNRNWKIIHVTSSNEHQKQKGVNIKDYKIYLNTV